MNITFAVSNWSGWVQSSEIPEPLSPHISSSELPQANRIPALLRRRLNVLGRAAASEFLASLEGIENPAIVYSSRHGDITRTISVLESIAAGEPVSPMQFSLSVHNAVPGVLSIHSKVTACISSIAAGDEALVPMLLEAVGLLSDDCPTVVCLHSDVAVPELYSAANADCFAAHAACFVVTRGDVLELSFGQGNQTAGTGTSDSSLPQTLQFVDFLAGDESDLLASHNGSQWLIQKR